jgi:uncharacterized protein YggT (Ycf19 family)
MAIGAFWHASTQLCDRNGRSMATAPPPDVRSEMEHEVASLRRQSTTIMIARVVSYIAYAWVILSLIILAFGFLLLLLGANPDAGFTQWVYRHLADTMEPFRGIFPQQAISDDSTVDVSVLFAMFVYSLIALGVRSVIDALTNRRDRLAQRIERDEREQRRLALDDERRQHAVDEQQRLARQRQATQQAPRYSDGPYDQRR